MHFRNLIVKGMITGIALFVPTNASAEEDGLTNTLAAQSIQVIESIKVTGTVKQEEEQKPASIASPDQTERTNGAGEKALIAPQLPLEASKKAVMALELPLAGREKTVIAPQLSLKVNETAVNLPKLTIETAEKAGIAVQAPSVISEKAKTTVPLPEQTSTNTELGLQPPVKNIEIPVPRNEPKEVKNEPETDQEQHEPADKTADPKTNEAETVTKELPSFSRPGERDAHSTQKMSGKPADEPLYPVSEYTYAGEEETVIPQTSQPEEGGTTPSRQENHLGDTKAVQPQQNPKGPGGSPKERTGHGQNTPTFSEKGLSLEKDWSVKLIQPHVARTHLFRNQWVNAPPSPPPKKAPFFLYV